MDFVADKFDKRYYLQSVLVIHNEEKRQQEIASLLSIKDSFKKVVIVRDGISWSAYDQNGIYYLTLEDFLPNPNSLDF